MPWSDWQDEWVASLLVTPDEVLYQGAGSTQSGAGTATDVASALGTVRAGSGADVSSANFPLLTLTASQATVIDSGFVMLAYWAAKFSGSVYQDVLPGDLPPSFPGSGFGEIPPDEIDANTPNLYVQYESGDTDFQGWADATLDDFDAYVNSLDRTVSTDTPATSWTPPTALTVDVGVVDPLTAGTSRGSTAGGLPFYHGPSLVFADLDAVVGSQVFDPQSAASTSPYSPPYTGPGFRVTDTHDIAIDLSAVTQQDLSLVLLLDIWDDESMTVPNLADERVDFTVAIGDDQSGTFYSGFFGVTPNLSSQWLTPRWRYWIPEGEWHTGGGYFANAGEGQILINTPGRGELPILDGPG